MPLLSQDRFRLLVENSIEVIWLTDLELQLAYVSPAVVGTLGYEPASLVGRCLLDLLQPNSREFAAARLLSHITEQETPKKPLPRLLELQMSHASGRTVHAEVSINLVRSAPTAHRSVFRARSGMSRTGFGLTSGCGAPSATTARWWSGPTASSCVGPRTASSPLPTPIPVSSSASCPKNWWAGTWWGPLCRKAKVPARTCGN